MNGMFNVTICLVPVLWGLGEWPKDRISLNFNYKVKDFKPNFVCLLKNERYRYRLFDVLCWLWNTNMRGSGAPKCIFHNKHKTMYNLFSPDPAVSCVDFTS